MWSLWFCVKNRSLRCKIFKTRTSFMGLLISMTPWHINFSQVMIFLKLIVINNALFLLPKALEMNLPYDRKMKWLPKCFHIYMRIDLRFLPSFIWMTWGKKKGNSSHFLLSRLDFCFLTVVFNRYHSVSLYGALLLVSVCFCVCVVCSVFIAIYSAELKQSYEIKLKCRQNVISLIFPV